MKPNETNNANEQNMFKNPDWQEAAQLVKKIIFINN